MVDRKVDRKLMLWAGAMIVITLGIFVVASALLPASENNTDAIAVFAIAGLLTLIAVAGLAIIADIVEVDVMLASTAVAIAAAGAGTVMSAGAVVMTATDPPFIFTVLAVIAALAVLIGIAGAFISVVDISTPKKQLGGIFAAEGLIIFGAMMIKIMPLIQG